MILTLCTTPQSVTNVQTNNKSKTTSIITKHQSQK